MRQGTGRVWRYGALGVVGVVGMVLLLGGMFAGFPTVAAESAAGKLTASDAEQYDSFGFSVALSADTALVGAYGKNNETGAVYIYTRANGAWVPQQKLTASDGAANDYFGFSVALSGDTAVIGALGQGSSAGAAYVFTRSNGVWSQQQKFVSADTTPNTYFGSAVAVSGDTAIVGADGKNGSSGTAYVYTRSGGSWTQQQQLTASDTGANDYFGVSVALSGDTALIGANGKDDSAGAAYVFTRSGTAWSQQQRLTTVDPAVGYDFFGNGVALSGDTAVVGAYGKNDGAGAAYVFTRSGTSWSQQQQLTAGGGINASVGFSVALSGDTVVVGAGGKDSSAGGAYVFTRVNGTWSQQQQLPLSDPTGDEAFGRAVAVNGDSVIVGAYGKNSDTGAAYAFTRSGTAWS